MNIFIIPIMYLVIITLVLWIIIATSTKFIGKILITLIAIYFSVTIHLSILSFMGYPTTESPPETFQLLSVVVAEPTNSNKGSIYMLIMSDSPKEPRLFNIPYSRKLHLQMQQTMGKLQNGIRIKGGFKKGSLSQNEDAPEFYELPEIELLNKDQ